jgi:AraC-like DNA-binding protein
MRERLFLRLDEDPIQGPESDAPAGTLRAFPVDAALRRHVAHILLYREAIPDGEVFERVLPDGAVRLVFNLADVPSADGSAAPAAGALGASAAPAIVRLRGRVEGLSVTLRPGAAAALLGVPAGAIADAAVPLDALWRGEAARVLERIAAATSDAARVAVLQHRLRVHDTPSRRLRQLIAASGGRRPLREVAAAVGVGERRLQQIFQAQVGLSPRAANRLARLHGLLRALRARPIPGWAQLALDAGYCDQSHLANEFRALCGLTPTEFLGRATSGSSKTAD